MSKLLALLAMVVMALAFLLGAAAYFLPRTTDWNAYKPDIVSAFAKHTGLQLQIQGDVEFVFLPRPRLTMKQGVIKNTPPRAVTLSFKKTSENILEVPQLDAYLDLIPLLTGKLNVDVRLVNPQLNIERFEDQLYNVSPFIQAIQKQHKGTGSTIGGEPDWRDRLPYPQRRRNRQRTNPIQRSGQQHTKTMANHQRTRHSRSRLRLRQSQRNCALR